jgi:hypothetical protein
MAIREIVAMAQRSAGFSSNKAERFSSLVTFDRNGSAALTLFHSPLVPLTTSSVIVVPSGFAFGNPAACIPRLAVHRGQGLNEYSKEVEAYFLEKLRRHFHSGAVRMKTNVSYSETHDRGDLDFLLFEPTTNRLLIAMVKAFIIPDTVEEVVRANQALEEGIQQVERARRWLASLNSRAWADALGITLSSVAPKVQFVVIGHGFSGSDYLLIPDDVAVVDSRYLLLPRFAGSSIFEAIATYQRRLAEESAHASEGLGSNSVELAGITIEFPGWEWSIQC